MSEQTYKAFISYSHVDERWARWLHRKIESYRVPKAIPRQSGRHGLELRPVFRDRDELASSAALSDDIQLALERSEALIVVCSQAAAESDWVCQEIDFFIAQHGPHNIYCFVVDPFQDFPPPLQEIEPLAADARRSGDGRDRARLKIIAGLLGVGFDELVQRDRRQRRINLAYRAGALTTSMLVAAGVALWIARPDPCPDPAPRMSDVWDGSIRERVYKVLASVEKPYAGDTAEKVVAALDKYSSRWRDMHRSACEATHVVGAQSDDLLDKRMQCLDERLFSIEALSTRLSVIDSVTVERASEAANLLPRLEDCADTAVLSASFPPPLPGQEDDVRLLSQGLADASAAFNLGQFDTAGRSVAELIPKIERTDYPPLNTTGFYLRGKLQAEFSDESLIESFEKALEAASRAKNDAISAEIWITYVVALSESLGDLEAAQQMSVPARVAAARLSPTHPQLARLANMEGAISLRQGKLLAARDAMMRAVQLGELENSPSNPKLKSNLALTLKDLAEFDAARELALEAYSELVSLYGAQHPATTEPLVTLGSIEENSGNLDSAIEYMVDALEVRRNAYGMSTESVAMTLRAVGWLQKEKGHLKRARETMMQSLDIYERLEHPPPYQIANLLNAIGDLDLYQGNFEAAELRFQESIAKWGEYPDNPNVAIPLTNLGALLNRLGRHAEALKVCRRALELDEATLGPQHPDVAYSLNCVGVALIDTGSTAEALVLLKRAVALRKQAKQWELAWSSFQLGRALWHENSPNESQASIREALRMLDAEPGPDPWVSSTVRTWAQQHLGD